MSLFILDPPGVSPYKGKLPPGAELFEEAWEVDATITEDMRREGLTPVGEAHAPNAELKDMSMTRQEAAMAKARALATQTGLADS